MMVNDDSEDGLKHQELPWTYIHLSRLRTGPLHQREYAMRTQWCLAYSHILHAQQQQVQSVSHPCTGNWSRKNVDVGVCRGGS
jgi:hypothetical protein